jgi:glycosidase
MIDRFNNSTIGPASTRQNPTVGFDQPEFQGGTFDGVMQQLDYIRELGAGAVWLTPVLKNCQYEKGTFHGYGIQDFLRAEPRFALGPERSDDELRALVDAIHARGMYVIFDIVLNHTGNVFGYVRAGQDNAPDAPFQNTAYPIRWHDQQGAAAFADFSQAPHPLPPDAAVWPVELQVNRFFRKQGKGADLPRAKGDFESLKQMVSEDAGLDRVLIRAVSNSR